MDTMRPLILLCASLASLAASAQDRDGQWRGSLSASFSYARSSTTSTNWSLGANAERATERDKWSLQATGLYGEKEDETGRTRTADRLFGSARYDRNFNGNVFGFGLVELERDRILDLDRRSTLGLGAGYHVIANRRNSFDLLGGVATTHTQRTDETNETVTEFLLGEESSHKLTENTSLKQKWMVYPSTKNGGEYRWTFDSTLATTLTDRIGFQVGVQHRYNTDVPAGASRSDLLILTGVNMKFGPK